MNGLNFIDPSFALQMDPLVSLHYYAPVCAVINACIIPFTEGFAPFTHLGRLGPFVMFTNAGIAFALNVSLSTPGIR
jgi:hypothetical protein